MVMCSHYINCVPGNCSDDARLSFRSSVVFSYITLVISIAVIYWIMAFHFQQTQISEWHLNGIHILPGIMIERQKVP